MIFHGDFFDESTWRPLPTKMPFHDSVKEYIRTHSHGTVDECAKDLGIHVAAVSAACASLVSSGEAKDNDD